MRICLTSTAFPPEGTGGIPRQRQVLARALARLGHEVHVITQGAGPGISKLDGVSIHTVPRLSPPIVFSQKYPALNDLLTHSQAVWEQADEIQRENSLDILDTPLWGLEGFVPICAREIPVALWLQTSRAQVAALDGRQPQEDDIGIVLLEKECLQRADGIIADSRTVLADFEKIYHLDGLCERARTVPLGILDLPEREKTDRKGEDWIELLLVGRLEKRKGTQWLFEVLPELLRVNKKLRARFIGADNSQWDGFREFSKMTYPDYFHSHWPKLVERVIFEGPVSEARLVEAYDRADILLAPSLYESFGLTYLEAMRASLPVITFDLGAAGEIFPNREADGACLTPVQDANALIAAVQDLAADRDKRTEIGSRGRARFLGHYTDARMAQETAACYAEIVEKYRGPTKPRIRRIFQVMEALDVGDAVSQITLRNAGLLDELGAGGTILSLYAHPQVAEKTRPVLQLKPDANAALIFHYWNYSNLEDFIREFRGPKAFHFHNITPPEYFAPGSPGYQSTSRGYRQLPRIINLFDLLIGDSTFNLETCQPYLKREIPSLVIPPAVEAEEVRSRSCDARLLEELQRQPGTKFLFVGRVARNKRQDRLIELFDHYYQWVDRRCWLYLVGSEQGDPTYRAELEALCGRLPSRDRIVFTGKVSEEALYSYYRAADLFACASEHEGFCVPLVEAMALDLPVFAYAAAAAPETLGESGLLIQQWNIPQVAELAHQVVSDGELRKKVLFGQRRNLGRFSVEVVKSGLQQANRYLQQRD